MNLNSMDYRISREDPIRIGDFLTIQRYRNGHLFGLAVTGVVRSFAEGWRTVPKAEDYGISISLERMPPWNS